MDNVKSKGITQCKLSNDIPYDQKLLLIFCNLGIIFLCNGLFQGGKVNAQDSYCITIVVKFQRIYIEIHKVSMKKAEIGIW